MEGKLVAYIVVLGATGRDWRIWRVMERSIGACDCQKVMVVKGTVQVNGEGRCDVL